MTFNILFIIRLAFKKGFRGLSVEISHRKVTETDRKTGKTPLTNLQTPSNLQPQQRDCSWPQPRAHSGDNLTDGSAMRCSRSPELRKHSPLARCELSSHAAGAPYSGGGWSARASG